MNNLDLPMSSPVIVESTKNEELKRKVYGFLRDLDPSSARRVTVEIADGVVTLRGRVLTFYARQLFVECCRRIPGVSAVVDELRVER
jgi:osmotically-inducible protein OsmY